MEQSGAQKTCQRSGSVEAAIDPLGISHGHWSTLEM